MYVLLSLLSLGRPNTSANATVPIMLKTWKNFYFRQEKMHEKLFWKTDKTNPFFGCNLYSFFNVVRGLHLGTKSKSRGA